MRTGDLDRRVLRSGTTLRFALLVVFTTAATVQLSSILRTAFRGTDPSDLSAWCARAVGFKPAQRGLPTIDKAVGGVAPAFRECVARSAPGTWRDAVAAAVVVYALAAAVYWWLPLWRSRHRRLVPVRADGELGAELHALAWRAGLSRGPRFVIDPAAHTTGAVAFGRWKHHTVCLHGGLVARRAADPQAFRTVVLHELAHIRNRDVDIAYATEALWRVSAVVVLMPTLVLAVLPRIGRDLGMGGELLRGHAQLGVRGLLDMVVLTAMILLTRADVLRTRELYADLDAVRWADPPSTPPAGPEGSVPGPTTEDGVAGQPVRGRPANAPEPVGLVAAAVSVTAGERARAAFVWSLRPRLAGPSARTARRDRCTVAFRTWRRRLRRPRKRAVRLFRTHPDWAERAASLRQPDVLFGTHSSTMVITGIAAVVAMVGLTSVRPHGTSDRMPVFGGSATTWLMAALLAGIAGVALWRRVVYAIATGAPVPAGLRAGFWLGVGVALGELVSFRAAGRGWLPEQPGWLLVPIGVACVLTWWAAQCAELWVAGSRGRSLRPIHLAALGVFFVMVGAWLVWWETIGRLYLAGVPGGGVDADAFGPEHYTGTPAQIDALRSWWPLYRNIVVLIHHPLVLTGGAALWLFPLIAWARKIGPGPPEWLRRAFSGRVPKTIPQAALPRLRSLVLLGLAGGTLCLGSVVVARLFLRPDTPGPDSHGSAWILQVTWWHGVALIAACAVWAAACAALATRCRAAVALASAGMAMCVGLAGTYLLASTEGCVPGIGVMGAECGWYGKAGQVMVSAVPGPFVMGLGMFVVAAAALFGYLVRAAVDRRRGSAPPARPPTPVHVGGHRVAVRRVAVGAVVVVVSVAVVRWWDPSEAVEVGGGSAASVASTAHGGDVRSTLVGDGEQLGDGVPVAGSTGDLEGAVDEEGQLGLRDAARQVEVDLPPADGHLVGLPRLGVDVGEQCGIDGPGVERHQETRRVFHVQGVGVDHRAHLVGGPDHDLEVASVCGGEGCFDRLGYVRGRGLGCGEDRVAALEQGPHVRVAESREVGAEFGHREPAASADVDAAQEGDVAGHARNSLPWSREVVRG